MPKTIVVILGQNDLVVVTNRCEGEPPLFGRAPPQARERDSASAVACLGVASQAFWL
ncbi:MAG: hypothetical protein QGH66_06805 [Dehalococcoidia bacterium]|nr:hypothetical protein [Dehalococcoidia bacterium]MDP7470139.1 hypothetical protein [Dehalococcoidia bacterium]